MIFGTYLSKGLLLIRFTTLIIITILITSTDAIAQSPCDREYPNDEDTTNPCYCRYLYNFIRQTDEIELEYESDNCYKLCFGLESCDFGIRQIDLFLPPGIPCYTNNGIVTAQFPTGVNTWSSPVSVNTNVSMPISIIMSPPGRPNAGYGYCVRICGLDKDCIGYLLNLCMRVQFPAPCDNYSQFLKVKVRFTSTGPDDLESSGNNTLTLLASNNRKINLLQESHSIVEVSAIEVYNLLGERVYLNNTLSANQVIELTSLHNGVYIAILKNKEQSVSLPFLISE
jgi:hypothetical protein